VLVPTHAQRVELWDAALAAIREHLRSSGVREVLTPPVVDAVAIEPWIEPVVVPGAGLVHTSPELAMKSLLVAGSGSIFQIGHVARRGERGQWHDEQFVMLEWYREAEVDAIRRDVERIVAVVADAVASRVPEAAAPPGSWRSVGFFDALAQTCGVALRGDETAEALALACAPAGLSWPAPRTTTDDARALEAWTSLFTAWSDRALDAWLGDAAARGVATHLVDFPEPLAALSMPQVDAHGRRTSGRFESHAWGRELANGYAELRDADEQRRRFTAVAELRAAHGLPELPFPDRFLDRLAAPGLPPCSGAAIGLGRVLALACGAGALADVSLAP
jgi:lysyl-tRNA synthetase class 2